MSKAKARVFVPLTKVDEEKRLVYGTITQEILDKSGEVMDYESSKPYFEKWSNEIHEASGGLSKGNLRVMHGLSVAGKLTDINFDDDAKAIDVCAKVVDDKQWEMVLEGCYTGFSVGGSYAKRWTDTAHDNSKVKKFTAAPNEVSLVDNPCVPSATFSLVKADGAEEHVAFKVENDDDQWPAFSKAEADAAEEAAEEDTPAEEDTSNKVDAVPPAGDVQITNDQVVERAETMAKAANDGTTWMNHVEAAREALVKEATSGKAQKETEEGGDAKGPQKEVTETGPATEESEAAPSDDDAKKADKVTPPGVKQVWTASDGKTFEKKEDAVKHEESLAKAEPTEAEKLRERLGKALNPTTEVEPGLWEDFDRLSKAVAALSTPFDDKGQPVLEKGMYNINRFSNVLSDMASLSRAIKAEAAKEGGDSSDATISADIIGAVKTLGSSFLDYAKDQVTELLAGMDDDVVVTYYDYYYAAAKDDGDNGLAKDITSLVEELREPAGERRETLVKAFGFIASEVVETFDEMNPSLQKRFDALESENIELRKVAGEAIEAVEKLSKKVDGILETPMPPAPRNVQLRDGDGKFFGKSANTPEEKMEVLQDMLKTMGPDAMAMELIKMAQKHPIPAMLRGNG